MSTALTDKIERLGAARCRKIQHRAARLIAQENARAGTGNVFSDLGLPSPEHAQLKAHLTLQIYGLIKEHGLRRADVAEILNPDQALASILMRNRSGTFSVERLQTLLATLTGTIEDDRGFGEQEFVPGAPFRGSSDVYGHFRERLAAEPVEHFYAVLLDNKHRKLRDVLVSKGSLSSSIVHPRDVYAQVIRHSAAAVIFVHNHPSGDPAPSAEDIEITRRLREVGDIVGVRVLDHIVIGRGRYVSFVDDGYW